MEIQISLMMEYLKDQSVSALVNVGVSMYVSQRLPCKMVCLILDLTHLSNHFFCDPLGSWKGDGGKMRPPPHY